METLTEQQELSQKYSSLKIEYYNLKRAGTLDTLQLATSHENLQYRYGQLEKKLKEKTDTCSNQQNTITRLNNQIAYLQKRTVLKDDVVVTVDKEIVKKGNYGQYVSLKTLEKQKRLVAELADKLRKADSLIDKLKEEIKDMAI